MVASPSNQFGDFGSTADPNMPRGVNTTTDTIKKGLMRQPPVDFIVEMLPPSKSPSTSDGYTFDMRITPLSSFLSSTSSSSATSSSGASTAHASSTYVIHRTWEDCLWFQESLSQSYTNRSRQKKSRLQSGKGLKSNTTGIYQRSDGASSWESLPYGPAPSSISIDLHTYLPKLTKKGTFFSPSQKTLDTRYRELKAFVAALFGGDEERMPVLLKEMRRERVVTDFFGVWRRDWDIGVKRGEIQPTPNRSFGLGGRKRANSDSTSSLGSDGSGSGSSGRSRRSMASTMMTTISEDSDDRSTIKAYRPAPPPPTSPSHSHSRPLKHKESWQTIDSAQTYLHDLGLSLPPSTTERGMIGKRGSVATFMTDASSEAVLQAEPEPWEGKGKDREYSMHHHQRDSRSSLAYEQEEDEGRGELEWRVSSSDDSLIRPQMVFSSSTPDLHAHAGVPVSATRESFELDRASPMSEYEYEGRGARGERRRRVRDSGISMDIHPTAAFAAEYLDGLPDTPRAFRTSFSSSSSSSYNPPSSHIVLDTALSNLTIDTSSEYYDDEEYDEPQPHWQQQQQVQKKPMVTIKASLSHPVHLTIMLRVDEEMVYEDVRKKMKEKVDMVLASEPPSSASPTFPLSPSSSSSFFPSFTNKRRKLGSNFAITTVGRTSDGNSCVIASEKDWRSFLSASAASTAGSGKVVLKILDTVSSS